MDDSAVGGHKAWYTGPFARTRFARTGLGRMAHIGAGNKRTLRLLIVAGLDLLAVVLTLQVVVTMGYPELGGGPLHKIGFIAQFGLIATLVFGLNGLYRQSWRFMRLADCIQLVRAVAIGLAVAWVFSAAAVPMRMPGPPLLITIPLLHAALLIVCMGAMRITRRQLREARQGQAGVVSHARAVPAKKAIVLGTPEWVSSVIDLVRGDPSSELEIVGALLSEEADTIGRLGGIPVLGGWEMLASAVAVLEERDRAPTCLILCDTTMAGTPGQRSKIVERAKKLDLEICQVSTRFGQLLRSDEGGPMAKLSIAELLGRPEFSMESQIVDECIRGRRILVTGAGGTIGGELARQLARFGPAEITLLDHAEHDLYKIDLEMRQSFPNLRVRQVICSIRERDALRAVFGQVKPEIVFHSAALKHVPIVEDNPCAGVHTNIIGTRNVADAVCEFNAQAMVQISTDKAVNPVGVMGATKRVGEIYSQALDLCGVDDREAPRFITVRFGNVLGSSGSVVPLFKQQIERGGPLTVTHLDITRYFMTVREAVQLILQSSSHALKKDTVRGNIYVLDMGEPVKIFDLAAQMIRLAGYEPEVDIGIKVVGLRPGEKLFEELFDSCEEQVDSEIPGIFEARSRPIPLPLLTQALRRLERLVEDGDEVEIRRVLHNLARIPGGSADIQMPFGDFGSLMAEYARGNFTVVSTNTPPAPSPSVSPPVSTPTLSLVETSASSPELESRWPSYEADEIEAAKAVLTSGRVNALLHGEHTQAFEEEFARFIGAQHAVAVSNGTMALELALRSLGIGAGHEVIIPARSFFATASCVIAVGAEPVFADIDPVSQNICPNSVARMIGPRTKAIICVHLSGWPCDAGSLQALCAEHQLLLIEDCAQAHGAAIGGRRVGSFGHAAAFSFCTDKIMSTAGEGGMLVTSDRDTWLSAWSYKDHGKSHEKVASGRASCAFRYLHDSFGSNFRLTEAQAAIGRLQLEKLPGWLARRRNNAAILNDLLEDHPLITTPKPSAEITHAWYKYNLQLKVEELQHRSDVANIVGELRTRGITCGPGSCPDMSKEAACDGREFRSDGNLPDATKIGQSNLMLAIDHLFDERQIHAIGTLVRHVVA
jgi:O-antigen biosynthesis protein WbqV